MHIRVDLLDGTSNTYEITPLIEYNAEQHFKEGLAPTLEKRRNSDVYWLAWECLRVAGVTVSPFGPDFMKTVKAVEIVDEDALPNG